MDRFMTTSPGAAAWGVRLHGVMKNIIKNRAKASGIIALQ
jgi:hypothetical protein